MKKMWRHLLSNARTARDIDVFSKQSEMFRASVLIIRIFYFSVLAFLIEFSGRWMGLATRPHLEASWPADWIWRTSNPYLTVTWIACLAGLFALLAALKPFNFYFRFLNFIFLQIFLAFYLAAHGYNNHSYYGFTLITFVLLALPSAKTVIESVRASQLQTIICMRLCAASLIVLYFVVGLGNVHGGIHQILIGEISIFSPISLAYMVLYEIQESKTEGILTYFVIEHYGWFWLGMFVILLKKLSGPFVLICRPRFVPILGVGFVLFHIFNALVFGLHFKDMALQVALFLIFSPIYRIQSRFRI